MDRVELQLDLEAGNYAYHLNQKIDMCTVRNSSALFV